MMELRTRVPGKFPSELGAQVLEKRRSVLATGSNLGVNRIEALLKRSDLLLKRVEDPPAP